MSATEIVPISKVTRNIADFLNTIPIFDHLNSEELTVLCKYMGYTRLDPGGELFSEGDEGHYVCFVASGTLDVFKKNVEGSEVVIATLHKGKSLGEMAIIDDAPRSATVRARVKSTLLLINRRDFDTILQNHSFVGVKILKGIARLLSMNLRKTSSRLADYMLPLS